MLMMNGGVILVGQLHWSMVKKASEIFPINKKNWLQRFDNSVKPHVPLHHTPASQGESTQSM